MVHESSKIQMDRHSSENNVIKVASDLSWDLQVSKSVSQNLASVESGEKHDW